MDNKITKMELLLQVGANIKEGYNYDECLANVGSDNNHFDEEADKVAHAFFDMCETGVNIYEAFVKSFF